MDFARLISDSWATTWRYRFLWVLALFAGGAAGVSSGSGRMFNWQTNRTEMRQVSPDVLRTIENGGQWALANVALLAFGAAILVVVALGVMVLWLIAQGGMAEATVELGTGHGTSLGRAWRAGMHLFWRYAGLWLSMAVLAIIVAALFGGGIVLATGLGAFAGSNIVTVVVALLVILPLSLIGLAGLVAVNIVITFAQRAIAAEDEGPLAALRSGWRLLRAHLAQSLLTWLVYFALSIGAGIALALAAVVVGGILVAIGVGLWAVAGLGAALVAYGSVGGLAFIALVLVFAAICNTFFWNYWTLAYLRLSGRDQPASLLAPDLPNVPNLA